MSLISPPKSDCMTMAAYNYDESEASVECVEQWMDWDTFCWALSDADWEEICGPVELDFSKAIKPEVFPNEDENCMTPEAYNWSDDDCGNLWRAFDDYCWAISFD